MIPSFAIPNYFIEEIISNGLWWLIDNYFGLSYEVPEGAKKLNKRFQDRCIENSLRGKECIELISKQNEIIEVIANPEFFAGNKLTIDNLEIYVRKTAGYSTSKKCAVWWLNEVLCFVILKLKNFRTVIHNVLANQTNIKLNYRKLNL